MLRRALDWAAGISEAVVAPLASWSEAPAQTRVTGETDHRPWPLPQRPWAQAQTWRDLLFAHWAVDPQALRPAVPAELPLDTFNGSAWIAVTPFEVSGLRFRGIPPLPGLSRFPETNVRTYTTVEGRPGIYFFSLDAGSSLAVAGARLTYRLPYFRASMSIQRTGDEVVYRTRRVASEASLEARYRPTGDVFRPRPGTLEHFLTERYCLYTLDERRRVHRADIHHPPWPLRPAGAELHRNTMTAPAGIELPAEPPLLHFSARQDVVIWALEALD
jgi:uncharacterized protein YqjF (DUF2071 family)